MYGEKCEIFTDHKSLKYILTQKKINMKQRRWLKYLKNYDLTISYHSRNANIMANALSKKKHGNLVMLITSQQLIIKDMRRIEIEVRKHDFEAILANLRIQPTLIKRIKVAQLYDLVL